MGGYESPGRGGNAEGNYGLAGYHLVALALERPFRCICGRCGAVVAEGTIEQTRAAWRAHRCR